MPSAISGLRNTARPTWTPAFEMMRGEPVSNDSSAMQIRVGYELIYDCPQPTPMLLMLNIHHTRANDIVVPDRDDRGAVRPHDVLPGRFWQLVHPHCCAGGPAATVGQCAAERHRRARPDRPVGAAACGGRSSRRVARLPPRKPVLRDRSADRHRVEPVRPIADRRPTRPGDLRLRPSPHHLQLPGRPIDEDGVGGVRGTPKACAATSRTWRSRSAAA